MKSLKNHRGFTLVEMIIVVALIVVVISVAFSMIGFSRNAHRVTFDEFKLQSDMRLASETISNFTRLGTAVFPVMEEKLNTEGKKNEWNYFTLEDGGTKLVHWEWDGSQHVERVLVDAVSDVHFDMTFYQDQANTRLLEFQLNAFLPGNPNFKMNVQSQLNAMNTARIDKVGDASNRPVALAYRTGARPNPNLKVSVTFVVDSSGSMSFDMAGNAPSGAPYNGNPSPSPPHDPNDVRMDHLKVEAKALIDKFASFQHTPVFISIIPFNSSANDAGPFFDAKTHGGDLKNTIDALTPFQGTNAGDGMRRAYFRHKDFYDANNAGFNVRNYMILLMDGDPTYWSSPNSSGNTHLIVDGTISDPNNSHTGPHSGFRRADGTAGSTTASHSYVQTVGTQLFRNNAHNVDVSSFVIAFTGETGGLARAEETAVFLNHPTNDDRNGSYYLAGTGDQLKEVFDDIINNILDDTWHIYGP